MSNNLFYIGDWQVSTDSNSIRLGSTIKQLEPKAMDVLRLLCLNDDKVLSADEIADQCWGNTEIGDNPVHKAITQLRKVLGDKASEPTYIETIRKRGYRIIAKVTFPLDETARAEKSDWQGDSPFPGLSAFESSDAEVFFGRNEQITTLLSRVTKQVEFGRGFCLILGPSGTGKSSLINAGLLPKLMSSTGYDGVQVISDAAIDFADVTQSRLLLDFASSLLDWDIEGIPVFDGMSAETLADKMTSNIHEVIGLCTTAIHKVTDNAANAKLHFFLFIDRLEVLLSSPVFSEEERLELLNIIEVLATSGVVIVFSACRNDFYPLVVNYSSLMAGKADGSHFDLVAPTRGELMQMIRLPAVAANLKWSKDEDSAQGLDEIICNDAANNPDALPMLQYTLQELYLQRNDNDELLLSVYKSLGGIEGAIGKKAEEIYAALPAQQQAALPLVLSKLVTLSADGKDITSSAGRWDQLSDDNEKALVQAMVDGRLFVSHLQNQEPCFSVAHEALLRRWSRASDWISDHKESLAIKSNLHTLSERWLSEDKSNAYLLAQGKPLQEAIALKNNAAFELEPQVQALINASIKRASVKRWITRSTVALLCLLTVTSVFMSFKSQQAEQLAQEKRLEAESLLGFMVGEFADKLRSVRRMDLLDGISNKALEYFSNQEEQTSSLNFLMPDSSRGFKAKFQHAQTLEAMGEVAYSRGKNDEATQAFNAAKDLLEQLHEQDETNLEVLKLLGANAFWLGQTPYENGDLDTARTYFDLYKLYSEKLYELAPDDVDSWIELSYAHNTLGSLFIKQENYVEAKQAFTQSLQFKDKALLQRQDDYYLIVDRADTLSWLATTSQHLGNLHEALTLHEQGQKQLESSLITVQNDAAIMESLAYSLVHQALLLKYQQKWAKAIEKANHSKDMVGTILNQDPDNELWRGQYLDIKALLLELQAHLKVNKSAINAEEVQYLLQQIFNRATIHVRSLVNVVRYYQLSNNWDKSAALLKRIHQYLKESETDNRQSVKIKLATANLNLLEVLQMRSEGKSQAAQQLCEDSRSLLQPLIGRSHNVEFLLPYVQASHCSGQIDDIDGLSEKLINMGVIDLHLL